MWKLHQHYLCSKHCFLHAAVMQSTSRVQQNLLVQPLAELHREQSRKLAFFLLVLVFLTPNDLAPDHLTTSVMQTVTFTC